MTEGPLGGPRPAAQCPLDIVFRFDDPITSDEAMSVESAISSAANEIGGATISSSDLGGEGHVAEIKTDREQVFYEEIQAAIQEFKKVSNKQPDAVSVNSD